MLIFKTKYGLLVKIVCLLFIVVFVILTCPLTQTTILYVIFTYSYT